LLSLSLLSFLLSVFLLLDDTRQMQEILKDLKI
jgi:hypothetical protein